MAAEGRAAVAGGEFVGLGAANLGLDVDGVFIEVAEDGVGVVEVEFGAGLGKGWRGVAGLVIHGPLFGL